MVISPSRSKHLHLARDTLSKKQPQNMDKDGEQNVCANPSSDVTLKDEDWLSNLPDCLLHEVLLNLPTKDAVKTSVLSSRWKKLWRSVPGLDLKFRDFVDEDSCTDFTGFAVFVEIFLAYNSRQCLKNFKLEYHQGAHSYYLASWISIAIERKVQHLHVLEGSGCPSDYEYKVKIPPTIYTCESLVSLRLSDVILPSPRFVCLPSLKDIHLEQVKFCNDGEAIDPKDLRNFLVGISNVKDMVISFDTLEVTYGYSECEPLPLFRNLSFLSVKLSEYRRWDMTLTFLESCPNVKSLVLYGWCKNSLLSPLPVPQCFKSSREYVEIETPNLLLPEEVKAIEMKLARYFQQS